MTIALRQQLRQRTIPAVSFGPLRFLAAMPWLVVAASMRVNAYAIGPLFPLAIALADIATLHAFLVVTRQSIELADGRTTLDRLDAGEQLRLSLAVLWRIGLLMIAASLACAVAGYSGLALHLMCGLDGMAFDQFTDLGKFWSAIIAALVLLMVIDAERNRGRVPFWSAVDELAQRSLWLIPAILVLWGAYLGLGLAQGWVRSAILGYWQTSSAPQLYKNLIYFVFIFCFATVRLWLTLLVLTFSLKQSYVRANG